MQLNSNPSLRYGLESIDVSRYILWEVEMTHTVVTSVLPSVDEANFEITSCHILVNIDKKMFFGEFTVTYVLKKVANNSIENDNWFEGTSALESDCKLISVLNKKGGAYKAEPKPNDGKLGFLVDFQRKLELEESIDLEIKYKRPLIRKKAESGFFYSRYLIVVESIFANICKNFSLEFEFNNDKCNLIQSIPSKIEKENSKVGFKKDILRPYEVYTVGLLMHLGILKRRESKFLSSFILMVIGALVSLSISEIYKLM